MAFSRVLSLLVIAFAAQLMVIGAAEAPPDPEPTNSDESGGLDTSLAKFFPSIPHLSAKIYATEDVKGQDADLGMSYVSAGMIYPVWRPDKDSFAGLYVGGDGSIMNITGDAKYPVRGRNLPDELHELYLNIAYFHELGNGWTVGGFVRGGSASDQLFNSTDEMSVRAAGFLRMPHGENNAWMVYLGFDSISDFPYPVPGFGYSFKTDKIRGIVGAPFNAITAEPWENVKFDFSYIPLRNVKAKAAYGPKDLIQGYVSAEWMSKRYLTADRRDGDDRLFYYEKNVKAGVEWLKWKRFSVDAHVGWAWDREFFEGDEYSDRNWNDVEIDDGIFGGISIRARF